MILIENTPVDIKKFPDNTPLLHFPMYEFYGNRCTFTWLYDNSEEMVFLHFLVRKAQDLGLNCYLDLPYIPNARQDRVKDLSDVFTLKYFCEFINSLNFKKVYVLDPHSNVSTALLNNVISQDNAVYSLFGKAITCFDPDILFFPDEGASKRYSEYLCKAFELPFMFGIKQRDWKTGKINGLTINKNGVDCEGKDILIFDDICSKGGTFLHSAKALKNEKANEIGLCVTHCENSILDGDLIKSGLLSNIYTTDTIFTKSHNLISILDTFRRG